MKTQLLEDIGESGQAGIITSLPAPPAKAPPARERAATGVWRQRPAEEPPAPQTPPLEEAAPLELDRVVGELAALEAQFVRPEPPQALRDTIHTEVAPQGPHFDFTPPAPASQAANPVTPAAAVLAPSRRPYPLWAACALVAALLLWGGRYLYQERNDAGALALVARASTAQPVADAPIPPAVPASAPLPDVPPLVMLEPDPPAAIKPVPVARAVAGRGEPVTKAKAVPAPLRVRAAPLQKPSIRKTRARPDMAAAPVKKSRQREPARQLARAPAVVALKPSAPDTSMEATLRACRAHGYHASQCIKRQCSVGAYGFACRGR